MIRTKLFLALTFALFLTPRAARGQAMGQAPYGLGIGQAPLLQVSGQYQTTRANAPPGQCGCFWFQGGGFQVNMAVRSAWSAMAEVYYGTNSKINGTDEQLSITNFTVGPRYSFRRPSRYTPYAQLLVGGSHVGSNYAVYSANNTFLAGQVGLGVEYYFRPKIAIVPIEADWVYSHARNGVNTRQNNTRLGFGVVYRFGPQ